MSMQNPYQPQPMNTGGARSGGQLALALGLLGLISVVAGWIGAIWNVGHLPPVPLFVLGGLLALVGLVAGIAARRAPAGLAGAGLSVVALLGVSVVFLFLARSSPVTSQGPTAVEVPATQSSVPAAVPALAPAPAAGDTALALPASFGVPECDEYARRACACSDGRIRAAMCSAATQSFAIWRNVPPAGRATIARGCTASTASIAPSCP